MVNKRASVSVWLFVSLTSVATLYSEGVSIEVPSARSVAIGGAHAAYEAPGDRLQHRTL